MTEEYYDRFWQDEKVINDYSDANSIMDGEIGIERILALIPKPNKILDVGSGLGTNTYFLNKIAKTIGIDLVEEPLRIARERYPNVEFVKMDITNTLFPDKEFDLIYSSNVIEHILDTEQMFNEFSRLLKPDGYLILSYPTYDFLKRLYITLFHWDKIFYPTNPHIRFYTKNTIKDILVKHGFELFHYESVIRTYGITSTVMVIAKKI